MCVLIRIASCVHTIYRFQYKKRRITINCPKSAAKVFSQGLSRGKRAIETAVVNEPSVFEPLKFYCICIYLVHVLLRVLGNYAYLASGFVHHPRQPFFYFMYFYSITTLFEKLRRSEKGSTHTPSYTEARRGLGRRCRIPYIISVLRLRKLMTMLKCIMFTKSRRY